MNKKNALLKLVCVALLLTAISLGTIFVLAGSAFFSSDVEPEAEIDEGDGQVAASIERWIKYGVLPLISPDQFDDLITYNQFAQIMYNLLRYTIDEKYTHLSGHLSIRQHEATEILLKAMGRAFEGGLPELGNEYLTYTTLSALLESNIQHFVSHETLVNLQGAYLEKALIINNPQHGSNLVALNIQGSGDIIIAPGHSGQIFFDSLHISGAIFVARTSHSVNLTINNSSASAIHLLGEAEIALIGNVNIGGISLFSEGPSTINTSMLANNTLVPNVSVHSRNARLIGNFTNVENNLDNNMVFFDGNIVNLYSSGNIVLIGVGEVENNHVCENHMMIIINPQAQAVADFDFSNFLADVENIVKAQLNSFSDNLETNLLRLQSQNFNFVPWIPPSPEQPPGQTGPPDDNKNPVSPERYIRNIQLSVVAPNQEGQRGELHIADARFRGTIAWSRDGVAVGGEDTHFTSGAIYTANIVLTAQGDYLFPSYVDYDDITVHGLGESIYTRGPAESTGTFLIFEIVFETISNPGTNNPPRLLTTIGQPGSQIFIDNFPELGHMMLLFTLYNLLDFEGELFELFLKGELTEGFYAPLALEAGFHYRVYILNFGENRPIHVGNFTVE